MRLALVTAAFALVAGCGYVGPPLPPALNIPKPVTDLSVNVIGDQIVVRFTPPDKTTEDIPVETLRAITLYVGQADTPFVRDRWSATARPYEVPLTNKEFTIRASDWTGRDLTIGLRTKGRTGKESDWSNFDVLLAGAPLIVPSGVILSNAPDAVALKWSGNAPKYRVMRAVLSDPMPKLEQVAVVDGAEYLDRTIAEGARYQYVIVGIEGDKRQSLPSMAVEFAPKDEFAPEIPTGPSAVSGEKSITVSWSRSPDDDLEGYNVFRAVGDAAFERVAQKVTLPAYTDTNVEAGKRYRYTVSAVDRKGNESKPSVEASAQVEAP